MSAGSIREFDADLKFAWTGRLIDFVEFEFSRTGQAIARIVEVVDFLSANCDH
jgi:hypothetical protein